MRTDQRTDNNKLTGGGGDVDVYADLRYASVLQWSHTGVSAKVGKLEVDDVQVCGSWGNVWVSLGNDHSLWAAERAAVFQPAEHQLLGWCGLHLTRYLHLSANLDVVVIMIGVGRDPKASFLQSCEDICKTTLQNTYLWTNILHAGHTFRNSSWCVLLIFSNKTFIARLMMH